MSETPHSLVVTPEQYKEGFRVLIYGNPKRVLTVSYTLIRRLPDGNYLVRDPH